MASTSSPEAPRSGRIAVLLHDLRGGGAERVTLKLVKGMLAAGREVDLVLVSAKGEYLDQIPAGARLVDLGKTNVFKAVPALARYLRRERPVALLASLTHVNIAALLAKTLAGGKTRVAVTEHNQITQKVGVAKTFRQRWIYRITPFAYRWADDVIAVSKGVAADVETFTGLKKGAVRCIYNPVFEQTMLDAAAMPVDHPWMQPGQPPVLLAAGRLQEQKGFDVLLKAFQIASRATPCRLIVMGEGEDRQKLEALARDLEVADQVSLAGFVQNPYAMMSRAKVFVLSSRWEGLPTVLVEAMACDAAIVSTNCPSGPDEILESGRYGALVPVEDPEALAAAIIRTLENPPPSARSRAQDFSVGEAAETYLRVLEAAR